MKQSLGKWAASFAAFFDTLCKWCGYAGAALIMVLPLGISYEVFMRYLMNRPTSWATDVSQYILFYFTFLAAAWLLKEGGHVRLTAVTDIVGPRTRLAMELFTSVIGAVICAILVWQGAAATWDVFQRDARVARAIQVPVFLLWWIIPFACVLLFIQFVRMARSAAALLMGGATPREHDNSSQ